MDILLVGGNPAVRGGVELFCERALVALAEIGGHRVDWVHSNTAYLTLRKMGPVLTCVGQLFRNRQQWDFVWFQYVNFPELFLLAACRLFGYRVLVTPHLGANWASQSRLVIRWIGLKLLGLADGVALLSKTQSEELTLPAALPRYAIKTFLPRAFPAGARQAAPAGAGIALVHAGRMSEGKGTFAFLEVCALLQGRGRAFSARLIGSADPATRRRIDAVIDGRGLGACVTLTGSLPEAQLMGALASADVLVHLSDIDSFPLIVLEAIGCGAFPICKDLPGARLICESYCGHIVAGPAVTTLVADFLCSTSLATLRDAAAAGSVRVAADYAWTACVAAVETAIGGLPR